jgi:mono/diheme cytochrome c family protein
MKTGLIVITVLGCVLSAACEEDKNYPNLRTGKELYEFHCIQCHGEFGSGMFLKGVTPEVLINSHTEAVRQKVVEGSGGMMPVFDGMPKDQVTKLATYMQNELGKK